jgi:hypothetical protein
MLPAQWKFRFSIMFVLHLAPATRAVAGLAFIPVTASVLVVTAMTVDTFRAQSVVIQFSHMANIALHFPVSSGKRIFGITIMIKPGAIPACL